MKKLIIAALAAATLITGTVTVSAKCGHYTYTDCARRDYCMEECPNDCSNDCQNYWNHDGMYSHSRGHHGRHGYYR